MMDIFRIIEETVDAQSNVSIKKLSATVGYSVGHLQRIFYLYSGMNIGTYIRRRRLSRAALWLKLSDMKVYEIAIISGFCTQQSFSRAFFHQFGTPPKVFRTCLKWPFTYYQSSLYCNDNPLEYGFSYINLYEICVRNIARLIHPVIHGKQVCINYGKPISEEYNVSKKYVVILRCDYDMNETDFITLLYDDVFPNLKIVLNDNVFVKIKEKGVESNKWCYYFPISQ